MPSLLWSRKTSSNRRAMARYDPLPVFHCKAPETHTTTKEPAYSHPTTPRFSRLSRCHQGATHKVKDPQAACLICTKIATKPVNTENVHKKYTEMG